MKLKENFLTYQINGETLLVPTAQAPFHGLGQGNETVGRILDCLKRDTSEEAIVDALYAEFDGNRREMAEDVHSVIAKLRKIGAIEE